MSRGTPPPDVVVVGSVNVDFIVRVDRLPGAGSTVTGGTFERQQGGKGANQAVAAARAGARVLFVGAIGPDDIGRSARVSLVAEGIDVGGLSVVGDDPTGVALIVVDKAGENQIAVASGANARLDAAAVAAALDGVEPAPRGVCLLGFEVPDDALVAAGGWAADRGLTIIVNPAPARPIPAALLALAPIVTPNAGEAAVLSAVADPGDAAHRLAARTGSPVVVTLGRHGALLVEGGRTQALPGYVVPTVDATGAGDAFNGILAARLAAGASLGDAVRWAMAGAALSTMAVGAQTGMPTLDRIARLIEVAPPTSR